MRYYMENEDSRRVRVFWMLYHSSLCGPHVRDYCVLKDERGFVQTDAAGNEQLLRLTDILRGLDLPDSQKGNVSRDLANYEASGVIRIEGRKIYMLQVPEVVSTNNKKLSVLTTFKIAGETFDPSDWVDSTTHEPVDEATRKAAVEWLDEYAEQWRTELREFKYGKLNGAVQGLLGFRILIDKKKKNKLASQPPPEDPPNPAPTPPEDPVPVSAEPAEPAAPSREAAPPAPSLAGQAARDDIRAMGARLGFDVIQGSLCDRIHTALKGAPLDWLEARASEPKNRRRMDGPGLLELFASDVAVKWSVEKRNAAVPEQKQTELDAKVRAQNRKFAEEILNDPESTERDRELAREVLKE